MREKFVQLNLGETENEFVLKHRKMLLVVKFFLRAWLDSSVSYDNEIPEAINSGRERFISWFWRFQSKIKCLHFDPLVRAAYHGRSIMP